MFYAVNSFAVKLADVFGKGVHLEDWLRGGVGDEELRLIPKMRIRGRQMNVVFITQRDEVLVFFWRSNRRVKDRVALLVQAFDQVVSRQMVMQKPSGMSIGSWLFDRADSL